MSVTTAKIAVCSRCGTVLGIEGNYRSDYCPRAGTAFVSHTVIFVLVVVPYA